MKFEDSKAVVVVNDHHGIYVAQSFAQMFEDNLRAVGKHEETDILLAGPEHEEYLDVWAELFPITLTGTDGKKFVFDQVGDSGDVWEIPEEEYNQIEWEEI